VTLETVGCPAGDGLAARATTARRAGFRRATLGPVSERDGDREVELDEDLVILPDQTRDDTDAGWGERSADNDRRLLEDRPPHW
jgi:hypothetical protein